MFVYSDIHYRRDMCCMLYFIATVVIASLLGQVLEYVEAITLSINGIFRLLYMYMYTVKHKYFVHAVIFVQCPKLKFA